MDWDLSLFATLFTVALIWAFYATIRAKQKVTKELGYNYLIVFEDVGRLPDLTSNPKFKGKVRVYSQSENHYAVQSHLNDEALKKIIVEDYGLTANQVQVRTAQLSGVVGVL